MHSTACATDVPDVPKHVMQIADVCAQLQTHPIDNSSLHKQGIYKQVHEWVPLLQEATTTQEHSAVAKTACPGDLQGSWFNAAVSRTRGSVTLPTPLLAAAACNAPVHSCRTFLLSPMRCHE